MEEEEEENEDDVYHEGQEEEEDEEVEEAVVKVGASAIATTFRTAGQAEEGSPAHDPGAAGRRSRVEGTEEETVGRGYPLHPHPPSAMHDPDVIRLRERRQSSVEPLPGLAGGQSGPGGAKTSA